MKPISRNNLKATSSLKKEDLTNSKISPSKLSALNVNSTPKPMIDLKKLNLIKNPLQSQSSLQLLIILLHQSLKFPLQQILGLFANQNKFLAHVIVKGVNQSFEGIRKFYQLLNVNIVVVKKFNQEDLLSCMYSIKTGLVAKDQIVVKLTMNLFGKFIDQFLLDNYSEKSNQTNKDQQTSQQIINNQSLQQNLSQKQKLKKIKQQKIFSWFTSSNFKCSHTLLLGIKRHQKFAQSYINLLFKFIKNQQINYFQQYYIQSIQKDVQFLNITSKILKYLREKEIQNYTKERLMLVEMLQGERVFEKWFVIAEQVYENNDLEAKLIVLEFINSFMLYLPQVMQKNQIIFNSLLQNWSKFTIYQFITLINHLFYMLQTLAETKSHMSKKIYTLIIDIFVSVYKIQDKRDYIVNNFIPILSQYPTIPSQLFIMNLKYDTNKNISTNMNNMNKNQSLKLLDKINPAQFVLICQAIDISQNYRSLLIIGDILRQVYFLNPVLNYFMGNLILEIVKKIIKNYLDNKEVLQFLQNLFKISLSNYVSYMIRTKAINKSKQDQPIYPLAKNKKNLQKQTTQKSLELILMNNYADLSLLLAEKSLDIALQSNIQSQYLNILKNYFLVANSQIKKNFFNSNNKKIKLIIQKKLNVQKQEQDMFQQENKKLSESMQQSKISRISSKTKNYNNILSLSKIQVPEKVTKQFEEIIAKRKKQEENKKLQQQKRIKQEQMKKIQYKKQLQKMNLIRGGFGQGQAQLKEQGFWNRFIKDKQSNSTNKQDIQVYTHDLIQDIQLQSTELIFKKYSKLFKYLFFNYSSTMYKVKSSNNFQQNQQRKQTITAVEIIKMLKDYKIIFVTNLNEIQSLVRDINVKILQRKQIVGELDYEGFEEFIKQFCLCCWRKPQRVDDQGKVLKMNHFTLPQLLMNLIMYLKNMFKYNKQSSSFFDNLQTQNIEVISSQLKQFNQKLVKNPNIILPQGYKKIIDKKIQSSPKIKQTISIPQIFKISLQIVDQIIFNRFQVHVLQPLTEKIVKVTAKTFQSINVKERDPHKIKARALSTLIDRRGSLDNGLAKLALTRNDLSKVMKKAMLSLKNQDKIIGQQVALTLEEMLTNFNDQPLNSRIVKIKSLPKVLDVNKQKILSHKRNDSAVLPNQIDKTKSNSLKKDFEKIKQQILQRKKKKQNQEKQKKLLQAQKQKRKKQIQEKYLQEQKAKIMQKKKQQKQLQKKKQEQLAQKRQQKKKNKQKFQDFNNKQVDKLKKNFQQTIQKIKKVQQNQQNKYQQDLQKHRKLRTVIQNKDKQITEIRKQTAEKILDFYQNEQFRQMIKQYQPCLKAVFEYLLKLTFKPLADKKCKQNQIDFDTWIQFNNLFELSPLIISSKDVVNIFKAVTKDKKISKDYLMGICYEQFLQALLRGCIKQKTIFKKLTSRIKQEQPIKQIVVSLTNNKKGTKKIAIKQPLVQVQNEFQEEQELDIRNLLKEDDVRTDIIDHYGDLSKFDIKNFKGLIYYLRMPFTKKGQQNRYRQLIEYSNKTQSKVSNIDKLKQKLKNLYQLERIQQKSTKVVQNKKKQTNEANNSQVKNKK